MDRVQTYFRQKVTSSELNEILDFAENADRDLVVDLQLSGIASGLDLSPAAPADLTVDVASGLAHDKDGKRLNLPSLQNVDLEFDSQVPPQPTAVVTPGNERVVSLFLEFDRSLSDQRTDGNGQTIDYKQLETIQFFIVAGIESAPPAVPPALDPSRILLADVRLVEGQTQIQASDIEIDRREENGFTLPTDKTIKIPASLSPGAYVGSLAALGTSLNGRVLKAAAADTRITVPIVGADPGVIVKSVVVNLVKVDGAMATAVVIAQDDDGSTVTASTPKTNTSAGVQQLLLDEAFDGAFFPYTVGSSELIHVQIETGAIGDVYASVDVVLGRTSL